MKASLYEQILNAPDDYIINVNSPIEGTKSVKIKDLKKVFSDGGGKLPDTSDAFFSWLDSFATIQMRNSFYRGKFLGEEWLQREDFKDIFLGDFWRLNNNKTIYVVAGFNYYQNSSLPDHMIILGIDTSQRIGWSSSGTVEDGFLSCVIMDNPDSLTAVKTAKDRLFSGMIIDHQEFMVTDTTSNNQKINVKFSLPSQVSMYGSRRIRTTDNDNNDCNLTDLMQLPITRYGLMALMYILNPVKKDFMWLKDIDYYDRPLTILTDGSLSCSGASSQGIMPIIFAVRAPIP